MQNQRQHHPFVKRVLSSVIVCFIICSPSISLGWGAGGHMMTADIAFRRLNDKARAKVIELLAIEIDPAEVTAKSKNFVSASHWADDLRPFKEFDKFKPLHFVDKPFSLDGTTLPDIDPNNIIKALQDNVEILKTSTDKKAQAQALRFVIHFVGDIHQPLHCAAKVTATLPHGDQGGNLVKIKAVNDDGSLRDTNLHSYWDGGIGAFPRQGLNYAPPPMSSIRPAADRAMKGNPSTNAGLKLEDPFDYDTWADESLYLAQKYAYKDVHAGKTQTAAYNSEATRIARRRVAWGGYRLAALLNAIWPE